ncbi:hypothetical protein [Streptomyces chartreusis]
MADDINLPNLVSHLAVNLDGLQGTVADASRQGSSVGSALGGGIRRQLDDLLSNIPDIPIDANSDEVDRDLARVRRELQRLSDQRIGIDIPIDEALRRIDELTPHLQRLTDDHYDVNVQAVTRQAHRQLDELLAAARRVDDTDVDIDVDVDEDRTNRFVNLLRRIPTVAGSAGGALVGVGTAAAGIGAAVPILASVVTTLANIVPAAGVGVTALASVQLASGAVKLAAVGMDDALSAALDPEKAAEFEEALKKLSPEAAKFATAVRDAAPALRDMQQDVQNEVFRGLGDELERTGSSVLPILRANLISSGMAVNDMATGAARSARELAQDGTLGKALKSASTGLHNLSGIPGIVVKSLGQIGAAAGPSFERLTEAAGEQAEKISERLTAAFESGEMEAAIEGAIDLVRQLFDVAENVGGIIGSIFQAAQSDGGGLLDTLETITGELNNAFASPEVQEGLGALFDTMSLLAETVAPLLGEALRILGPVIEELAPPIQELITTIGEQLDPILDELGPVLIELADVFGEILFAATPLIELFGEIAREVLPMLVPLLRDLADLIREISPVVRMAAEGLSMLLLPVLEDMAAFLEDVVSPALRIVIDLLRGDYSSAQQTAAGLTRRMIDSQVSAWSGFPGKVRGYVTRFTTDTISSFQRAGAGAVDAVRQMIINLAGQLARVPEIARQQLGNMGATLYGAGRDLISGLIDGISSMIPGVKGVLNRITAMIPKEKGPPSKDAKILTPAGRLLIEGFIKGINDSTAKLRSRLASITKALPANVRSGIGKTLARATAELEKQVTRRDVVVKKLAAAQKKLDDLVKARSKAASDITKGILDEADITTGHADVNSVSAITVGLQQALKATTAFQANIAKLRKAGLRSDLLQQIADAGVEAGGATAAALARATPAELKKINDLQAQLAKSATATGNTVGDALYQAGINAAKGLVAGLKSQEAAIEAQMKRIAQGMLNTVKKAHKTRSPSREFRWIGEMDGQGLEGGLLASVGRVRAAAQRMAGAALDVASGVSGAIAGTPSAAQLSAVYAGGGQVNQTYYIELNGARATPQELVRELSWQGLIGRQ